MGPKKESDLRHTQSVSQDQNPNFLNCGHFSDSQHTNSLDFMSIVYSGLNSQSD